MCMEERGARNGEAQNTAREMKRQVCVQKVFLEEKLQEHILAYHPLAALVLRHWSKCLSRWRIGDDGWTADLKEVEAGDGVWDREST